MSNRLHCQCQNCKISSEKSNDYESSQIQIVEKETIMEFNLEFNTDIELDIRNT